MKVSDNCRVRLNYTIRLDDGEVVDRSPPEEPLEFVTGRQEVIPVLEECIKGMESGEKKSFNVGPDEAFGSRDPEAIRTVNRSDLQDHGDELEEGMMFRLEGEDGHNMAITVIAVDEERVTFDLNHPLAGMPLTFDVEILEVNEPSGQ
ncbi:MAG: peptidylprolyl isomerase [bacterium]